MATLLNNYNIRTFTHIELYTNGLAAAETLSNWLNSINVAVTDPITKVSLAINNLDVEILERLKRYSPDPHTLTWNQLVSRLFYFILGTQSI